MSTFLRGFLQYRQAGFRPHFSYIGPELAVVILARERSDSSFA
jgi:hypothetical protein